MMNFPMIKRLCAMMMILLLTLPGMALAEGTAPAADAAAESGMIRVLLKSLGDVSALNLTMAGSYTLDGDTGFLLNNGVELRATAVDGEIWLDLGGITLRRGKTVTLTRHQAEGLNGLYIEGSQRGKLYAGSLCLTADGSILKPVLKIDLEEYLYGVVPYEMSESFPIEALKAQAVAARTYALQRRAARTEWSYDVVDTAGDQVFMGYDPAYVKAIAAVDETRGLCGIYQGEYATCYYTASNGGQTAMAHDVLGTDHDDSYLAIVDDPYDLENPSSKVTSLTLRADGYELPEAVAASMKGAAGEWLAANGYSEEAENIFIDAIADIQLHTPLYGEPNRMYQYMQITYRISACPMVEIYSEPTPLERLQEMLGQPFVPQLLGYQPGEPVVIENDFTCDMTVYEQLKDELGMEISSKDCEIPTVYTQQGEECMEYVIELRRYGHGVGMSQRGAQWMAGEYALTHEDILKFYYPGLTFEKKSFTDDTLPGVGALPEGISVGSGPTVGVQKELPALMEGEKYAKVNLADSWSTLNMRSMPSTEGEIITTLRGGWRVIVMAEADGWAHVRTADHEGYVSGQYLTDEKTTAETD